MSKKQGRNELCNCGSGKKYKICCNIEKDQPIKGNTLQFLGSTDATGKSELSKQLHSLTGYYAEDYNRPVRLLSNNIFDIISDESFFKGHYCVSLVIMQRLPVPVRNDIEYELNCLENEYELDNIHFTDILGKGNVLGNKKEEFLEKYTQIVNKINLSCLSISESRDKITRRYGISDLSDDDIYFNLFRENFKRLIPGSKNDYIINVWKEQDNNFGDKHTVSSHHRLWTGIDYILKAFPDKYISICKYPMFFMKRSLLMSSLADLVAYVSNKVQNKIDNRIPLKKIRDEYYLFLKLIKDVFNNFSGLTSKELIEIIDNVYLEFDDPKWVKWYSIDEVKQENNIGL
jgi:hypothetical protein